MIMISLNMLCLFIIHVLCLCICYELAQRLKQCNYLNTKLFIFLHFFIFSFVLPLQLAPFCPVGSSQLNFFQSASSLLYFFTFPTHCHTLLPCALETQLTATPPYLVFSLWPAPGQGCCKPGTTPPP